MKKILALALPLALSANGALGNFAAEVRDGLDVRAMQNHTGYVAAGELGTAIFGFHGPSDANYRVHIPMRNYIRMGAGINNDSGLNLTTGLGWNLTQIARAEINLSQGRTDDARITTGAGMLYLDFVRRFDSRGDIIVRRTFVPFAGAGFGVASISADECKWAAAPRAEAGVNIVLTDFISIDLAYRFDWHITRDFDNSHSFMTTLRFNF